MRIRLLILSAVLAFCATTVHASGTCTAGALAAAAAQGASSLPSGCWYVDFAGGSDLNNGTSEATPFKNAPGMQTCANSCAGVTVLDGSGVILKGGAGETWPNASFQWNIPSSATNGSPNYYGVDKSWFAGSSWTKPVLSAGGAVLSTSANIMINMYRNTILDNFEITGYYWTSTVCVGNPNCVIIDMGQIYGQVLSNLYIHGWSHGAAAGLMNVVLQGTGCGGGTCSISHDNVIVGTDNPGDYSAQAFYGGPPVSYNNYLKTLISGYVIGYGTSIHDNHIEDIGDAYCNPGCGAHQNGFEDNGSTGMNFYNNTINNVSGGLALWVAPNPSYTVNVWNNVIWGVHGNNVLDLAGPVYSAGLCSAGATTNNYCKSSGTYNFYNNTVQCGDDTTQYDQCQSGIGNIDGGLVTATAILFKNNHIIDDGGTVGCYTGTGHPLSCSIDSSNISQTQAIANGQGYTSLQSPAVFFPTPGGATITAAGSNLTSIASGALATLASDTTYACTDLSNAAACPARATNLRPSSGSWQAGAYQYVSTAPPSVVLSNANTISAVHTTNSVTFTNNLTTGDLIDVMVQVNFSGTLTATAADNCSNTYSQTLSQNNSGNTSKVIRFYAKNINGCGAATVTVTFSASIQFSRVIISEIAGVSTIAPVDQTTSLVGTGTALSVSNVTTTSPSEILIGCGATSVSATPSAGTGFSLYKSQGSAFCESKVVSATGAYNATATENATGSWIMTLVTYK